MSNEFVALYRSGMSIAAIAHKTGHGKKLVRQALIDAGEAIKPRGTGGGWRLGKATVNHTYFDAIDCEEKAYWLGFLMADGSVVGNNIALVLNEKDALHVERFRDALGSTNKVIGIKKVKAVRFAVSSPHMVGTLSGYGVVPSKSWIAEPAELDTNFVHHYWRGLVDGDGSPSWNLHKGFLRPKLQFCGTLAMCEGFADFCRTIVPTKGKPNSTRWVGHYHIGFSDRNARLISSALYSNSTIALDRKYQVFQTFERWKP